MGIKAVIFDMDGLLIDSEPLWQEAAHEVLHPFGVKLSLKEYETTTGLRTKEFIDHWFRHFNLPQHLQPLAVTDIIERVKNKIMQRGMIMPGVPYIIDYFLKKRLYHRNSDFLTADFSGCRNCFAGD